MNTFNTQNPKVRLIAFFLFLAVIMLISGCDILLPAQPLPPTATTTQIQTVTPTIDWFPATPTPTGIPISSPTPRPTLADMRDGVTELLVDDDFTDASLWRTQQGSAGNVAFGNQNLSLAVAKPSTSLTSLSQHAIPADFYLEITLQTNLCQAEDQIGILFWYEADGYAYRILVNCAGQVRLELLQGGRNNVVHDWERASQMQLGSPANNRLGVWVADGRFQLYINDVFQFEETIANDQSGGLAVFARTISSSAMTIRFSDLQVYRVEPD